MKFYILTKTSSENPDLVTVGRKCWGVGGTLKTEVTFADDTVALKSLITVGCLTFVCYCVT